MSGSALVFKVLRLRPPEIHIADGHSPFVFEEDVAPSLGQHPQDYDPTSLPFADRVDARAAAHQTGVTGNLILRSAFGTVYIGQRLRCAVILQNASKVTVNNVGINVSTITRHALPSFFNPSPPAAAALPPPPSCRLQVELQSEHGKSLLYETMSSPGLPSLAPGQHLEVAVEHEIKELGPHTIVCSSSHTISPQGERTYQPQAFRFVAHNPLLVRTKVRKRHYITSLYRMRDRVHTHACSCRDRCLLCHQLRAAPGGGWCRLLRGHFREQDP